MASTHTPDKTNNPRTEGKAPDTVKNLGPTPTAEENIRRKTEEKEETGEARTFTYIGAGEDSPRVINFMGIQKFVRGEPTKVFAREVIRKLVNNPTFVEGEADQETLHRIDEDAKIEADKQRQADAKLNASYVKKHRTE